MITRYIADHRSIFEVDTRRAALVEILRLFSDVGWSDALKLLYDLPDLLADDGRTSSRLCSGSA